MFRMICLECLFWQDKTCLPDNQSLCSGCCDHDRHWSAKAQCLWKGTRMQGYIIQHNVPDYRTHRIWTIASGWTILIEIEALRTVCAAMNIAKSKRRNGNLLDFVATSLLSLGTNEAGGTNGTRSVFHKDWVIPWIKPWRESNRQSTKRHCWSVEFNLKNAQVVERWFVCTQSLMEGWFILIWLVRVCVVVVDGNFMRPSY